MKERKLEDIKGIHYLSRVTFVKEAKSETKEFLDKYSANQLPSSIPVGVDGTVKEVHGNNVTVNCKFNGVVAVVYTTKDCLKLEE
jgi:hypothetical protein